MQAEYTERTEFFPFIFSVNSAISVVENRLPYRAGGFSLRRRASVWLPITLAQGRLFDRYAEEGGGARFPGRALQIPRLCEIRDVKFVI